jgi:hypothetical protein
MDATNAPDELHAPTVTNAVRTRPQRSSADLSRVVDGEDIQRSLDLWYRLGYVPGQLKDLGPCVGSARATATVPSCRRSPRGAACRAAACAGSPANLHGTRRPKAGLEAFMAFLAFAMSRQAIAVIPLGAAVKGVHALAVCDSEGRCCATPGKRPYREINICFANCRVGNKLTAELDSLVPGSTASAFRCKRAALTGGECAIKTRQTEKRRGVGSGSVPVAGALDTEALPMLEMPHDACGRNGRCGW